MRAGASWLALAAIAAACSSSEAPPALQSVLTEPVTVVPSAGLPPEVVPQDANNNLDVVRHEGRVYLAFRTGPSHFASKDVVMYVVSSTDQTTWRYETKIALGTDVREPRFLSWRGELHLYFAVLGDDPIDFEPGKAMQMFRDASGAWSEPVDLYLPGFIPWRAKVIDGRAYMVGYVGGENIYDEVPEPLEIHWLTSDDGVTWRAAVEGQPVVLRSGGSETDFVFTDGGALIAVVRNEAGDETGWGSKVCRAEAGALGKWSCKADPRKYDSPLVFRHGDGIYLIGRRNLASSGLYDLGREDIPREMRTRFYQLEYSGAPKRCALWRVDPDELRVHRMIDLPSRGDTCFPGLVGDGAGGYTVYNYTSPLDGEDVTWLEGQLGRTLIYRAGLRFDEASD